MIHRISNYLINMDNIKKVKEHGLVIWISEKIPKPRKYL